MPRKLRLAMYRVDNHLYHFIPVLADLDMRRYRELSPECHYWFTDCYRPFQVVPRRVSGFEVVKLGDADPGKAAEGARVFRRQPISCSDITELARDVDAGFLCNCSDDGSDHLGLAEPFLRRRIPLFIDKPFALATKDAIRMVALARRYRTPIYSTSLLSVATETGTVRYQFREIGRLTGGSVCGAPGWHTPSGQEGVIHGVSLTHAVFGYGIEWVRSIGKYPANFSVLGYASGLETSMNLTAGIAGYTAEVFGANRDPNKRHLHTGLIGNTAFAVGAVTVCSRFKRMVATGRPPRAYEEMIADIAVCEALRRSWKLGRKVSIREVWKQAPTFSSKGRAG